MCKRAGLLIGWDEASKRALVTRADCDSWLCPECAERMRQRWVLRAQIGVRQFISASQRVDFVTITGHEALKSFAATERVWREAWPVLYAALKRQNRALQFIVIPEKHHDGRMHVHSLWTAGVSQRWLKDNARARGLGYKASVTRVGNALTAGAYVTKYIGKSLGDDVPKRFRRVRVSRGWPEIPAPLTDTQLLRWEYVASNGALERIYAECRAKNINLIDLHTGQVFDDIDLGTLVDANWLTRHPIESSLTANDCR